MLAPAPSRMSAAAAAQVAIAIPALNEEQAIGEVVRGIAAAGASRIIVADGGSTDRTVAEAAAAGAEVIMPGKGYGRACWMAAQAADKAAVMVFMDGDGADDPGNLNALATPILAGECDLVIGSRARGNREAGSMAWHQLAAGSLAGLAIGLLYGTRYTDMCAFRAIRREALLDLGMREMGYGWNIEMQMRAAQRRLRIREIPVDYRCRFGGQSKVAGSLRGTMRAGTRIIATFCRVAAAPARLRHHRPSNDLSND
jgi:glycosyltransferase involved in cell wall biosynthesis